MQKRLLIALWAACWSAAVIAQSTPNAVTRDPNPPYGAAAGAAASANQTGAAGTGNTAGPVLGTGASGSAATASGAPARPGAAANSSGASTTSGSAQGTVPERPGAAIASRGSTTATSAAGAAPYDPSSTPGWTMMTPQEQQNYSGRMSSITSVAQCRAYHQAYMAQIQARARSMGQIVQSEGADPCAALQQQGALK